MFFDRQSRISNFLQRPKKSKLKNIGPATKSWHKSIYKRECMYVCLSPTFELDIRFPRNLAEFWVLVIETHMQNFMILTLTVFEIWTDIGTTEYFIIVDLKKKLSGSIVASKLFIFFSCLIFFPVWRHCSIVGMIIAVLSIDSKNI